MKAPVSVVLIVRNEAAHISPCLEGVAWCDERIVIDQGSEDETVQLARRHTDRVLASETRGICNPDRERGMREARHDWVLILEADERVSPALRAKIESIAADAADPHAAYTIAFRHYFLGKWITSCGWYPSDIVRLVRKGKVAFPAGIHTHAQVDGSCGRIAEPMLHYSYDSIAGNLAKIQRYTDRLADEAFASGKRIHGFGYVLELVIRPLYFFCNKYVWRLGVKDGFRGFYIAFSSALTVFMANAKLWERQIREEGRNAAP
ncbi:MAG: glycosyltransferase family 2 protein [Kiritimatiellae bacterium]|nr:glycosyltransferase family 2 protein [Kiritimatiellia bacterium]